MTQIVQVIHERNIDIFLGQETNRPTRTQQFQATKQYLLKHKQHIVTAETKWIFESEKKPGGTFCITNNTMRHMITRKIIDHMGRWAGNVYQLQGIQIAIISIYQTVQTCHPGFTSIHAQQVAMLTNEDRDITPRQAFSIDLMELVQNLQKEGLEILIAGDFNAYITSSGILKELQDKCHLFRINDTTGIVSYRHGTKCLDHVFASHKLSEAVTKLHYEEYPSDYYSNHRPIFIQLDIKALQSSLKPPQEPKRRRLYSKDPENVKLYIERKFKLMQQYKIEDLLSDLEDRINALQA